MPTPIPLQSAKVSGLHDKIIQSIDEALESATDTKDFIGLFRFHINPSFRLLDMDIQKNLAAVFSETIINGEDLSKEELAVKLKNSYLTYSSNLAQEALYAPLSPEEQLQSIHAGMLHLRQTIMEAYNIGLPKESNLLEARTHYLDEIQLHLADLNKFIHNPDLPIQDKITAYAATFDHIKCREGLTKESLQELRDNTPINLSKTAKGVVAAGLALLGLVSAAALLIVFPPAIAVVGAVAVSGIAGVMLNRKIENSQAKYYDTFDDCSEKLQDKYNDGFPSIG